MTFTPVNNDDWWCELFEHTPFIHIGYVDEWGMLKMFTPSIIIVNWCKSNRKRAKLNISKE